MEDVADIPKMKGLNIDPKAQMAINCEWVRTFDNLPLSVNRSRYRVLLIRLSMNICLAPNTTPSWTKLQTSQANKRLKWVAGMTYIDVRLSFNFQKLISGRYLGEILRLVICELIDEGILFLGQNTYKLESPYVFETAFLSLMERCVMCHKEPITFSKTMSAKSDPTDELLMIIGIFSHFFAVETTLAERQFFRALAQLIGRRAARLSACGIAAIVSKKGYLDEGCSVGADGSLYNVTIVFRRSKEHILTYRIQKYPGFAERIHEGLVDIFGERGR